MNIGEHKLNNPGDTLQLMVSLNTTPRYVATAVAANEHLLYYASASFSFHIAHNLGCKSKYVASRLLSCNLR